MKLSRLYTNRPELFTPVDFNAGLNVVLAQIRQPENRAKDTHNLGKTTLGRLIDFCFLAGKDPKVFLFKHFELFKAWFFHNLRNPRVRFDMALPEVSKRELEVLSLPSRGRSSKQIARELEISESTANFHIASVKRKFGVRTRGQAIARAVQAGLIR